MKKKSKQRVKPRLKKLIGLKGAKKAKRRKKKVKIVKIVQNKSKTKIKKIGEKIREKISKKRIGKERISKESKEVFKDIAYKLANYLIGENGKKIIDAIYGKKNVSEFSIAKKTSLTIYQTRSFLYNLASKNIVNAIRKKGRKKGWYTTYYVFNLKNCLEEYRNLKLKKLREIEDEIKSKKLNIFYACSKNCVVMKEDKAILNEYFCPECGELMQSINFENTIKKLGNEKEKVINEIQQIELLIQKLKEKVERKRMKKEVNEKVKVKVRKGKQKTRTKIKKKKTKKK